MSTDSDLNLKDEGSEKSLNLCDWKNNLTLRGISSTYAPPSPRGSIFFFYLSDLSQRPDGYIISLALATILGVISNLVLFCLLVTIENLWAVRSFRLIASLCIANVLFCGMSFIFNVLVGPFSHRGIACVVLVGFFVFFLLAAAFARCIIAMERYLFIVNPLGDHARADWVFFSDIAVVCQWALAALIAFTPYVGLELNDRADCLPFNFALYIALVIVILIAMPFLLMSTLYSQIFYWAFMQIQILKRETRYVLQLPRRFSGQNFRTIENRRYSTASQLLLKGDADDNDVDDRKSNIDIFSEETAGQVSMATPEVKSLAKKLSQNINVSLETIGLMSSKRQKKTQRVSFTSSVDANSITDMAMFKPLPHSGRHHFQQSEKVLPPATIAVEMSAVNQNDINTTKVAKTMDPNKRPIDVEKDFTRRGSERKLKRTFRKSEIKAIFVVLSISGGFIVCWVPFLIIYFTRLFTDSTVNFDEELSILFVTFISLLDPLLYGVLNHTLRSETKTTLRRTTRNTEFQLRRSRSSHSLRKAESWTFH